MSDPSPTTALPDGLFERLLSFVPETAQIGASSLETELWHAVLGLGLALIVLLLLVSAVTALGRRWARLTHWFRIWIVTSLASLCGLLIIWGLTPLSSSLPQAVAIGAIALFVLCVWGRVNFFRAVLQALAFAMRGAPATQQPIRYNGQVGVFRALGLFSSQLELESGLLRVWNDRLGHEGLTLLGPPHSTRLELELELEHAQGDRLLRDLRMLATLSPFRFPETPVEVEYCSNSLRRVRISIISWATEEPARARRALRQTLVTYLQQAPESR